MSDNDPRVFVVTAYWIDEPAGQYDFAWMDTVFLDELEAHAYADQMNAFWEAADNAMAGVKDEADRDRIVQLIGQADDWAYYNFTGPTPVWKVEYVKLAAGKVAPQIPAGLLSPA